MPVLQAVDGNGSVEDEDIFVARQLQSLVHNHELEDAEPREPARDVPEVARVWKESCEQVIWASNYYKSLDSTHLCWPYLLVSLVR